MRAPPAAPVLRRGPHLLRLFTGSGLLAVAAVLCAAPAAAQDLAQPDTPPPAAIATPASADRVAFEADQLDYDDASDTVTASGNVVLNRDGQRLRADRVSWNRTTGEVIAEGGIAATDAEGNRLYGERATLTDSLRDGVIAEILVVLAEGGRLAARRGERLADGRILLDNAAYTGCDVEDSNGCPKEPSWKVTAERVVYDPARNRIRYSNARIDLFGLPLVPLPGLSHPTGTDSASGLLAPDIGYSEANGLEYTQPYYFALAPNRDFTVAGSIFSATLPMVSGTYRALTGNGAYQVTGYLTASDRIPISDGTGTAATQDTQLRGYLDTNGRFRFGSEWTIDGSIRVASDRTFLRRYDISDDDRLRSVVRADRVDADSYFSLAGWAVQTLRVGADQGSQPVALPVVDYRLRLPEALFGGRFELRANSLALGRTDGQDTQRAFAGATYEIRRLTPFGMEVTGTALVRGDLYHSDDNALSPTRIYRGESGWQGRAIAAGAIDARYPLAGPLFGGTQILTPRVQLVATPDLANLRLPNEDSRAIDLEDSNLFAINRFPGHDRFEDGVRVTYGLDWLYERPNLRVTGVIGQSYRFSSQSGILPDGTGLSERTSDIVGRTDVRFRDVVRFTHRYRLDKDNLDIRRNEVDAAIGNDATYLELGYLRLNRNIDSLEDLADREEARMAGRVQIGPFWSVFGSAVLDLTDADEDPLNRADGFEPVRTRLGVAYDDECLSASLTWSRDFDTTGDDQRGNRFLLSLALRNIGI